MEPPLKFCKYHNAGARCKLGESHRDDGSSFHFCKRDEPCIILNEKAYDKFKE